MGIVNTLINNVVDFLDKRGGVDASKPDLEICEETEEQQLQRQAEIEAAIEDMRRQECAMSDQP